MESLTKYYGVKIIVTEATEQNQPKFVFRKLDLVRVKGKKTGVALYELICTQEKLTPELVHELEKYHQALECYFQQKWDEAFMLFTVLHEEHPEAKIYSLYLDRVIVFKTSTLPNDWDGVYVHANK